MLQLCNFASHHLLTDVSLLVCLSVVWPLALPAEPDNLGRQRCIIGNSLWQLQRNSSNWNQAPMQWGTSSALLLEGMHCLTAEVQLPC